MEREVEKSREELKKNRISKYLKPMKPTSCPRVVCSSGNSISAAKKRYPRDETVQVGNPESSSSYDIIESEDVAKERPQRAVPDSVTTPGPKLKPQSTNKGIKRGRFLILKVQQRKIFWMGRQRT